ncbi:MAG: lysozyme inhibitor LprI family protein [Zoogloeaceae bacterium]|jgi:uncharacterized protein YecT (DUF1311 family)|nr:lysozyme inhibitor LprI family protein [Zoogloeaceae bacterium]
MKPPAFFLTALIGAAFSLAVAHAEEAKLTPQFEACMNKAATTVDTLDCIGAETERQDKRLNKAYKSLQNTERKKTLQDAQRAWLKYREANCAFYYDPEGGTLATVEGSDCFMSMTARRANELEALSLPGELRQ